MLAFVERGNKDHYSTGIEQQHSDFAETETNVVLLQTRNRRVELLANNTLPHRLIARVECLSDGAGGTGEAVSVAVHLNRLRCANDRVL